MFVGPEGELFRRGLTTGPMNRVSIPAPTGPIRAGVHIRYERREAAAVVTPAPDGTASILFDEPQKSVAAGQWAVLYDGDVLLGGGVIEASRQAAVPQPDAHGVPGEARGHAAGDFG